MKSEELKKALLEETPVAIDGMTYAKISAIIYRKALRFLRSCLTVAAIA